MKLIIFDFDGTLFDTKKIVKPYLAKELKKFGIIIRTDRDFQKVYLKNFYETLKQRNAKRKGIEEFKQHTIKERLKDAKLIRPFKGMPAVLKKLKQKGIMLAIISSNFRKPAVISLKHSKIFKYFDAIIGAEKEENKVKKIKACIKRLNIKPSETAYVGDTSGDIIEAKKAKVIAVAASWGFHPKSLLRKAKPDMLISNPIELVKLLK